MKINVCFSCGLRLDKEGDSHHECLTALKLAFKNKSRWRQFVEFIFICDFGYYVTFLGGAILNGLMVSQTSLTDTQKLIEAMCMGAVMMRLFKRG